MDNVSALIIFHLASHHLPITGNLYLIEYFNSVDSQYSIQYKNNNEAIFAEVQIGCQVPPPNVVILEAAPEPNKDDNE